MQNEWDQKCISILFVNTEWRTNRRWRGNIKIDLIKMGCERMYWIHVAQVQDSSEHGNEPSNFKDGREFLG